MSAPQKLLFDLFPFLSRFFDETTELHLNHFARLVILLLNHPDQDFRARDRLACSSGS